MLRYLYYICFYVLLYGCKTWSYTLRDKHTSARNKKNRSKIFEPKRVEIIWKLVVLKQKIKQNNNWEKRIEIQSKSIQTAMYHYINKMSLL